MGKTKELYDKSLKEKFADIDYDYIERIKEDPVAWQKFLAKGRTLVKLERAIHDL